MADVARVAGVSPQTVSRVINESGYVGARTRERVLAAMRELNYRPNSAAQRLVTGRSKTVGVVTMDATLFGPAAILRGLERAAHAGGYFVSIASIESLDRQSLRNAVERLERQGVDGILLNAGHEGLARTLGRAPVGVPVVSVEEGAPPEFPMVVVDQFGGASDATGLLLELGHRTVWHVAGPRDWEASRRRVDGWRATLEAAGADVPEPLYGDWSPASGHRLGRRLAADPSVTAIFAANDQMALGVLRALHEAGRDVPREVSVIGFDDIPEARYLTPPLTTIRQDFDAIGRNSLELLLKAIDGNEDPPSGIVVTPELIVRDSTAGAPRS
jgi:DNA-binding LacI/PurR family transcriptional regulator